MIIRFQRYRRLGFIANKFAYRLQNGFGNDLWNSDLGSDSSCDSLYLRGKREMREISTKFYEKITELHFVKIVYGVKIIYSTKNQILNNKAQL